MKAGYFRSRAYSLADLLGDEYVEAVCAARSALAGEDPRVLLAVAGESVDLFPAAFQDRLRALLPRVGQPIAAPLRSSPLGASSGSFNAASRLCMSPLSGFGYYRVGEDGRLRVISKSEHYHASLGHAFPGYRLIEHARRLGIPNATHNNTRGYITRLLEEELIRAANGLPSGADLGVVRASRAAGVLNRVLNLETGSLAVEAALKMILARFYSPQADGRVPPYRGRQPVLIVVGGDDGEMAGNYHGTTVLTQVMRGLWPELQAKLAASDALHICAVRPNCIADVEQVFDRYERAPFKVAGFFHEIVMMNYGARRLTPAFLTRAYERCARCDAPAVCDEIQSCLWQPDVFLFREYGLRPDFVAVGKGFPGGEYPASRILFSAPYDTLAQFGALVTNGQEELASLAYLITMTWAHLNRDLTRGVGERIESGFRELATRFRAAIEGYEGSRHLSALRFRDLAAARAFAVRIEEAGFDISVQSYKSSCPPVALTKLPLIADEAVVDRMIETMERALGCLP